MDYLADLHIHSRYSRATSGDCDLPHLDEWARRKGILLVGTGDFTHPAWRREMAEQLLPAEEGLYLLKEELRLPCAVQAPNPRFVVTGEISCIYKRDGKVRKVHNVILLPSLEDAEKLSAKLEAVGNIRSDGRPILGLDSRDLLEMTLEVSPSAIFVPAHIWTPHFSLFGAFSGFDTLTECFGDLTGHIRAVETGLSSDPPMNWRVPLLDNLTLISNSDAHSPAKLGREANLLDAPLSYPGLKAAIERGEGFSGTVEFFPEEGKYHLDGHRACGKRLTPAETEALGGKCPVCGKKITIGVLNRVEQLAVRPEGHARPGARPFYHLMPLAEVLSSSLGFSATGERAARMCGDMTEQLGPEIQILMRTDLDLVRAGFGDTVAEGLRRLRAGEVHCAGGYDGEYGTVSLFLPGELERLRGQMCFLPASEPAAATRAPRAAVKKTGPGKRHAEEKPTKRALNGEQAEAVSSAAALTAVLAGPGTGKTATLVERAAYLIRERKTKPERITCVTFTNQAAAEMRERLAPLVGARADKMTVGTFHAVCLELLGEEGRLIGHSEAVALAEEALAEAGLKTPPASFLQYASSVKNGLRQPEGKSGQAFERYNQRLKELNMLDFDDLLARTAERDFSGKERFTHILVDEFQDINDLQYRLLKNWSANAESLFVIGDPDQSIYGFRGAGADCFNLLAADHPDAVTVRLTKNYRSTPQVLNAALAVISHNPGGERILSPQREDGPAVWVVEAGSELAEAIFVAKEIGRMTGGLDMLEASADCAPRSFSDIAVLCRTHRHAALIEKCLREESIPCVVTGREDYLDEPQVRGALGFFRALAEHEDVPSLRAALLLTFSVPHAEAEAFARAASEQGSFACLPEAFRQAAGRYLPRLDKETPKKLLEDFGERFALTCPAYEKLLKAAALAPDMRAMLSSLLLGTEADIKRSSGSPLTAGAVRLMTLHAAKGLEFPAVFLCGLCAGGFPPESARTPEERQEERRLLFVGMTRAREELVLTFPGSPSPFLAELAKSGVVREKLERRTHPSEQLTLF